jgi:hypothetical protein
VVVVDEAQLRSSHIILHVYSQADRFGYEAREAVRATRIRRVRCTCVNWLTPLDDLSFENTVTASRGSLRDETPLDLYSTL